MAEREPNATPSEPTVAQPLDARLAIARPVAAKALTRSRTLCSPASRAASWLPPMPQRRRFWLAGSRVTQALMIAATPAIVGLGHPA